MLVCQQCAQGGQRLTGPAARSEILAHLASHARRDLLPAHLRTCQCHERGCGWHPRHRGCHGPIRLLLARDHGGRAWRLTDACTACAAATSQAAVVPETILAAAVSSRGRANTRRRRHPKGPDSRTRVQEMLNYLAVALPAGTGADARLIALQCALRVNNVARVRLPLGLLRSLRLGSAAEAWRELSEAGWLRPFMSDGGVVTAQMLDAALLTQHPARPDRLQAADWAVRSASSIQTDSAPLPRLAALALAAHTVAGENQGAVPAEQMARECGCRIAALPVILKHLVAEQVLVSWTGTGEAGDLRWELVSNRA